MDHPDRGQVPAFIPVGVVTAQCSIAGSDGYWDRLRSRLRRRHPLVGFTHQNHTAEERHAQNQ